MSSIIVERLFWIHRFRILLWSFHARICRHIEYLTTPVFDKALFSTSAELQPIPSLHFRQTCYETNIVNEKMFSPIKNERNTSTFLPPSHHHHHTHTSVVLWSGCLIVRVTSSQFQTRQYKLSPPELLSIWECMQWIQMHCCELPYFWSTKIQETLFTVACYKQITLAQ